MKGTPARSDIALGRRAALAAFAAAVAAGYGLVGALAPGGAAAHASAWAFGILAFLLGSLALGAVRRRRGGPRRPAAA